MKRADVAYRQGSADKFVVRATRNGRKSEAVRVYKAMLTVLKLAHREAVARADTGFITPLEQQEV